MREPQRHTIGDVQYSITPMSPIKASKLLTKLLKLLGEPLAKLAESKKAGVSIMDQEVNGELISQALGALTDKLDENEMEAVLRRIFHGELITYCEGGDEKWHKMGDPDGHFSRHGGMSAMFKLAKVVLEVNYSDFLGEIVGGELTGVPAN